MVHIAEEEIWEWIFVKTFFSKGELLTQSDHTDPRSKL
jgi:hypothetical protein